MFRRAHGGDLNRELALLNDTVGDFFHHLLQQHSQMRVPPVISRRDVFHPIGVGGELVHFLKPTRAGSSDLTAIVPDEPDDFRAVGRETNAVMPGSA